MIKLTYALVDWKNVTRIGASAAITLLLVARSAFGQIQYAITDLGTLGGYDSVALDINNNSQVVGEATDSSNFGHAFLYTASSGMKDLGRPPYYSSRAFGINNNGQVVGTIPPLPGIPCLSWVLLYKYSGIMRGLQAFLMSGSGPMQDLGSLGGEFGNVAFGINDGGNVVGYANSSADGYISHAFLYAVNGPMQDLGTLGGMQSTATAINNSGQIVGIAQITDGQNHAFFYSGSGPLQDLGTLGGTSSGAHAINDSGQIVGSAATIGGQSHAFFYSGSGPLQDLGTLGGTFSSATAINNCGQVVGSAAAIVGSATETGEQGHAFLRNGNGPLQDINNLISPSNGWTLIQATGINDKGQIVGDGFNPASAHHAFLLSPLSTITTTSGGPPNTLSSTLKPIDTTAKPPSGNLKRWNGSSWQSVTSWSDPSIDTEQPTVVIAHGWKTADGDSDFFASDSKISGIAKALYLQNSSANILAWDWQTQAVSNPVGPLLSTFDDVQQEGLNGAVASATRGSIQGILLAHELQGLHIGNDKLQLIGHSNGGAVVGAAASELAVGGQKVERLTLLDTPNVTLNQIPQADLLLDGTTVKTGVDAMKYICPSSVSQLEVYYSDGLPGRAAFGFGSPLIDSSAANVFNGRIYPGSAVWSAPDAINCDHLRIIDWYYHVPTRLPGSDEFVAGINWSIVCSGSSQWKAGNFTEQGYDSKVFGTTTLTRQRAAKLVQRTVDGFEDATEWIGQKAHIFMRDAGNAAARLTSAIGGSFSRDVSVRAEANDVTDSASDGYLYRDVSVPGDASYVTFDLKVEIPGPGDFLTVTLGDQIIFYQPLGTADTDFHTVAPIYVGNFAGQTQTLLLTLNHVGEGTLSILLDNITFLSLPSAVQIQGYTCMTNDGAMTIIGYDGPGGDVTIPDMILGLAVTSIEDGAAFDGCTNLANVTIPNTVTNIGDGAFGWCISLTGIYFKGDAPSLGSYAFYGATNATVYYLPGTTGWGTRFGGLPTALWNPQVQTSNVSFGVRTNQFGFTITGTSNLVIVVEACTDPANPAWFPVGTNTLTGGSSYFSDPQWTNYPARLYRLRSP